MPYDFHATFSNMYVLFSDLRGIVKWPQILVASLKFFHNLSNSMTDTVALYR